MSIDAQILTALREAGVGTVSGTELSQRLGISRAAVWAHIEELRTLGYEIEASPHRGYRLINVPDVLHADDLYSRVESGQTIGRDIRVFQETTSTNDVIEKLARDGVEEGVVVIAEKQTKGRGRLGREWRSPSRKGLWFSVLLRPDLLPQSVTQLTIAGATSLVRAIHAQTGLTPEIKWPNDILIHGKKTAGILTEMNAELDHVKYVILGIGVDVNQTSSDFPSDLKNLATSLRIQTGEPISRAELLCAMLNELDRDYHRIQSDQFEQLNEEWNGYCTTLGHNLVVRMGDRLIQGRAESLDANGALLLRTEHGHLERVIGGDVTLES